MFISTCNHTIYGTDRRASRSAAQTVYTPLVSHCIGMVRVAIHNQGASAVSTWHKFIIIRHILAATAP